LNLATIGRRVEEALHHAPETLSWKTELYAVIDRVYQGVLTSRSWPFLLRAANIPAFPDTAITPTLGTLPADAAGRTIQESVVDLADAGLFPNEGANDTALQSWLVGGELHVTNAAARDSLTANWSAAPFVIERVKVSATLPKFHLDPRASLGAIDGTEGLELRFPRIRLPTDVAELISVQDDTGAFIPAVNPTQARVMEPIDPAPGDPRVYAEDAGFANRLPISPLGLQMARHDQSQQDSMVVRDPEHVVTSSASGTWSPGTWEVALCWSYSGRFGPLTEPQTVTTPVNGAIVINGLPVVDSSEAARRIAIFVRNKASTGPYYYEATVSDPTVAAITIQNRLAATKPWEASRYEDEAGPYTHIHLYPRPSRFRMLRIEYRFRPQRLSEPSDTPLLPEQHHELLVWLAVQELAASDQQTLVERAKVLAREAMNRLLSKYPEARYRIVKGQVGARGDALPFLHAANIRYIP
jgi:hypothetical protein